MFASGEVTDGCSGGTSPKQAGAWAKSLHASTRGGSSGMGGLLSSESLCKWVVGALPLHTGMKTCWLPHLHGATSGPTRTILKLLLSPCHWIGWVNVVAVVFLSLFLKIKYQFYSTFILFLLYRFLTWWWEFQIPPHAVKTRRWCCFTRLIDRC